MGIRVVKTELVSAVESIWAVKREKRTWQILYLDSKNGDYIKVFGY